MRDDFIASLERQHGAVGRFLGLLEQEQTLLAATPVSIDMLSTLTEEKSAQAAELEALEQARQAILVARGHTPDRAGAERLAATLGCTAQWQAFIARVDQAQTQNRINGLAIDTKLDFNQRTLAFLQRATGHALYGPTGQKQGLGGGKGLHSRV